jgi:hypothetical protein
MTQNQITSISNEIYNRNWKSIEVSSDLMPLSTHERQALKVIASFVHSINKLEDSAHELLKSLKTP